MTMPDERTRALLWAGELLEELQMSDDVSDELRKKVIVIRRHYPSKIDIEYASKSPSILKDWLAPVGTS